MITIRNKCDYDNEVTIMTSKSTHLDGKLAFFMRFLAASGHFFDVDAELRMVEKDEMVWTDAEIAQLKKETIADYLEGVAEAKEGSEICYINQDTPDNTGKDNYMDEAPF